MEVTLRNIICLSQVDQKVSRKVKEYIKAIPGEAFSNDISTLHDHLRKEETTGLPMGLHLAQLSSSDINPVISSEDYKTWVETADEHKINTLKQVQEDFYKARFSDILRRAADLASSNRSSAQCIKELTDELYSIPSIKQVQSIQEISYELVESLTKALKTGESLVVESKFKQLNSLLFGGIANGSLITVGGDTGAGKTTLALNMMDYWCRLGMSVLYVNLEMSNDELMKRLCLMKSGQNNVILSKDDLNSPTEKSVEYVKYLNEEVKKYKLDIIQDSDLVEISQKVRQMMPDIVVIDHLHLLQGAHELADLQRMTTMLKHLARDTNKIIVCLGQYNRGKSYRDNQSPTPSDFRGSSTIEQDSDLILQLHCPNKEEDDERFELHLTKARQGQPGVVYLNFNKNKQMMEEQI